MSWQILPHKCVSVSKAKLQPKSEICKSLGNFTLSNFSLGNLTPGYLALCNINLEIISLYNLAKIILPMVGLAWVNLLKVILPSVIFSNFKFKFWVQPAKIYPIFLILHKQRLQCLGHIETLTWDGLRMLEYPNEYFMMIVVAWGILNILKDA